LEKLKQADDVDVVWHSFELRPQGSPPMPPEYRARIEAAQPRLLKIAREQYNLELNRGPLGIHSRSALIGANRQQRAKAQYHDAVFRAYWQRANNIDVDVLAEIARSIGLSVTFWLPERRTLVLVDAEPTRPIPTD
jgi:predicted DsbA family dithiol-disulfide isomerase